MAKDNKHPEADLKLRYAEAEHLIQALQLTPLESQKTVTHQGLMKQLTAIRDYWLKLERERKAKQKISLRRK